MTAMHVGMVPAWFYSRQDTKPAPHARGDGPDMVLGTSMYRKCSPRMWGWSQPHTQGPGLHRGLELTFPGRS